MTPTASHDKSNGSIQVKLPAKLLPLAVAFLAGGGSGLGSAWMANRDAAQAPLVVDTARIEALERAREEHATAIKLLQKDVVHGLDAVHKELAHVVEAIGELKGDDRRERRRTSRGD